MPNPIPSPDGKFIAYVRTGWGRPSGTGGTGRSNLVSEVAVVDLNGIPVRDAPLCDSFVSGWTPDSEHLICYRDWIYALTSLDGTTVTSGHMSNVQGTSQRTEWVAYAPAQGTVVWIGRADKFHSIIESPQGVIARTKYPIGERIIPSPDGKYFAVFGTASGSPLYVYDALKESWKHLADISIFPDYNWSYIQPSWNPWFADSSRLVYFSDSVLTISSPDGQQKTEIRINGPAGLPTPSPNGLAVAFVTFDPRPMNVRPDLSFWGDTTINIVPAVPGAQPRAITHKNSDSTYDLKWLNSETLVFDRIADVPLYMQTRLWKVTIPR